RRVLGDLVGPERIDVHDRQIGAVDHPLLRGRDDLTPGHRHRVGSEAVHGVGENPALLHAHLEPLEIGRRVDGPPVVPEVTEAVVVEEHDLQLVLLLEGLVEVPPDLAVEHGVGVVVVADEERREEHAHLRENGAGGPARVAEGNPGGAACTVFPEMCVFLTPFLVRDYNHAYAMFNGEIGRNLDETFQKKYKLKVMFFYDYGFRHFWNNRRPINTPADLK